MSMFPLPENLRSLLEKPVAILGAGVSGRAVDAFLREKGIETVIYDENLPAEGGIRHRFPAAAGDFHRLVVFSPGFPRHHPWRVAAREQGIVCLGEIDLASYFWPGKVIAVTGTNGKSTTVKLLAAAMNRSGLPTVCCGNIGTPFIGVVSGADEEAWAVCEVSSFQAEDLFHLKAAAVIWTNFDPDHLEYHGGLGAYFRAKHQLLGRRLPGAPAWVGRGVEEAARSLGLTLPGDVKVVRPEEGGDERLSPDSEFRNSPQSENYSLVRAIWSYLELPPADLRAEADAFVPLPHRLELVVEHEGLQFWNDSKATNFSAALAALHRFPDRVYWIAGGRSKGGDLRSFLLAAAPKVRRAFFIGETAPALRAIADETDLSSSIHPDLVSAVQAASEEARRPARILFSPGFSSFDQFVDYSDRGNRFREAVACLVHPSPIHCRS